jgi:HD-GYP domain-containing protein (c-di-GMP phosphodiesterase class II)/class 3 adenylate cyclase
MEQFKYYVVKHFEQTFILLVLSVTALLNYYLPNKLSFLTFYFLPIILCGYYVGRRMAVLGSVFCVLFVTINVIIFPNSYIASGTIDEVYLSVISWGGFLVLAGAVVGRLQEQLVNENKISQNLNKELKANELELAKANTLLQEHANELEEKIANRTEELQQSKEAIESLKNKVEDTLHSTMDSSVVNLIIEGRLRNEKRPLSVLFSDLDSFTNYSESIAPELVIRDLNCYLAEMEPIIFRYRGHIDKYMGDGIMCEFGAPLHYSMYKLLSVLAAMSMQESIKNFSVPWTMRIGIASGSAITGLIGNKRKTYSAIGDVVNLASRLENLCQSGGILIDESTMQGVNRFIQTREIIIDNDGSIIDDVQQQRLWCLNERLNDEANNASLLFERGQFYMDLQNPQRAILDYQAALKLSPDCQEYKLHYAEASLQVEKQKGVEVKGKEQRIEVYEVVGLKDPLQDRNKIPHSFYQKYSNVRELIDIPWDVVLPTEALDGCIGHSIIVSILSYAIAEELGLSDKEKLDILQAGLLADLGKEVVPLDLLNRNGPLTASEYKVVQTHVSESVRLMQNMGYTSETVQEIVMASHEKYSGNGYPNGLQGTDIPIGSRIILLADDYDALTSWRPYRDAWNRHAGLDEIKKGLKLGYYDPQLVDILITLLTDND